MRPFQFVKSRFGRDQSKESRLSKEFRDKTGSEIVDIVSDETTLQE